MDILRLHNPAHGVVQLTQRYNSSAVEQFLVRVAAQEESWHSNATFATPEKLRLHQQLRSC
eukprot:5026707-Pleurochrysis_carterae.AAC.1